MASSVRLRALKGLVIFMGVLIVILSAILIGELLRRAFSSQTPDAAESVPPLSIIAPGLPDGARIIAIAATRDHVVLHVEMADGGTALFLLDPDAATDQGAAEAVEVPEASTQPLSR